MTLLERIDFVLNNVPRVSGKKWSDRAWCIAAGLSSATIASFRHRVASKPESVLEHESIVRLAQVAGISPSWLANGSGSHDNSADIVPNHLAAIEALDVDETIRGAIARNRDAAMFTDRATLEAYAKRLATYAAGGDIDWAGMPGMPDPPPARPQEGGEVSLAADFSGRDPSRGPAEKNADFVAAAVFFRRRHQSSAASVVESAIKSVANDSFEPKDVDTWLSALEVRRLKLLGHLPK